MQMPMIVKKTDKVANFWKLILYFIKNREYTTLYTTFFFLFFF